MLGLVVAVWVEGQCSEDFAGGGVDDADVEVLDEHDDVGSLVGSADADVVESAVDTQGDDAAVVDAVVTDSFVGLRVEAGVGQGLGQVLVAGCWWGVVWL